MKLTENTYFISDVHIGVKPDDADNERVKLFIAFLKRIESKASRIFFVGDIFDFWFEYKHTIPKKYFSVLHQIGRLSDRKIEMYYLAGNHDFYLGNFFNKEFAMKTYENEYTGKINNKNFYVYHGDGIAKRDIGYRILKKIIRNKLNIKLYKLLHPDIARRVASLTSYTSRAYLAPSVKSNEINIMHFRNVAETYLKDNYDAVIFGHIHEPYIERLIGGTFIIAGDWITHDTYVILENGDFTIHSWKETKRD